MRQQRPFRSIASTAVSSPVAVIPSYRRDASGSATAHTRRGRRIWISVAAITPRATTPMMRVASALTSGETPSRILEKITIGKVLPPGPDTKLAITRSSSDRVNASSHAATPVPMPNAAKKMARRPRPCSNMPRNAA